MANKDAFCSKCGEPLYMGETHICEPDYTFNPGDVAGFDLCGWKLQDGSIQLQNDVVIAKWPKEIEIFGNTYTLEEVTGDTPNEFSDDGRIFQNAMYV